MDSLRQHMVTNTASQVGSCAIDAIGRYLLVTYLPFSIKGFSQPGVALKTVKGRPRFRFRSERIFLRVITS